MRVLVDNCVPRKFARLILGHEVVHARQMGWHELKNGQLLTAAQEEGFDVMITMDKNLRYQQNLSSRTISVVILAPLLVFYESLEPMIGDLESALANLSQGTFVVIEGRKATETRPLALAWALGKKEGPRDFSSRGPSA